MDVSPAVMADAIAAIEAGEAIGIPTDTVYGLAAHPFLPGATRRIFAAKRRPDGVALPVLVRDREQAMEMASDLPEGAEALMERFWPGPLTVVVRRRDGLGADLGTDSSTVGLRSPAHAVPLAICAAVGPLAVTSANLHRLPPCVTAARVAEEFGAALAVVVDGGRCDGSPSTVVDCTGAHVRLLRAGRLPWAEVLAAVS